MVAGSPAFLASAAIAAGVMSGVPTICSCLMLEFTVLRPLKPMTMATTPNAMRTAAAAKPPISNALRMSVSFVVTAERSRFRPVDRVCSGLRPRAIGAAPEAALRSSPGIGAALPQRTRCARGASVASRPARSHVGGDVEGGEDADRPPGGGIEHGEMGHAGLGHPLRGVLEGVVARDRDERGDGAVAGGPQLDVVAGGGCDVEVRDDSPEARRRRRSRFRSRGRRRRARGTSPSARRRL